MEELFFRFDRFLNDAGFRAEKGQIIDASIVKAPVQRNSREENELIKAGEEPEGWSEAKRRQKDVEARWTKKNSKSYFGYKNHIGVDVKHKLIRKYQVTSAEVHDSQVFEELLSPKLVAICGLILLTVAQSGWNGWVRISTGNMCSAKGRVIILFLPGSSRATGHVPVFAAG